MGSAKNDKWRNDPQWYPTTLLYDFPYVGVPSSSFEVGDRWVVQSGVMSPSRSASRGTNVTADREAVEA